MPTLSDVFNMPDSADHDHREYTVIHDDDSIQSTLECRLESALEAQYSLIVVEPTGLGNHVIRWIRVGNFLHKSAVLASFGCLFAAPILPRPFATFTSVPLGLFGVGCALFYDFSWRSDPCCKYQVDYHGSQLVHLPSHELHSQTPVVLVRKNDKYRKVLHNTLALCVVGYFGWRLYQLYKSWKGIIPNIHAHWEDRTILFVHVPQSFCRNDVNNVKVVDVIHNKTTIHALLWLSKHANGSYLPGEAAFLALFVPGLNLHTKQTHKVRIIWNNSLNGIRRRVRSINLPS